MKNILRRIYRVITNQFIRLPEVPHSVVFPGIHYLREKIQKIEIKLCVCLSGMIHKFRYIDSCCHGNRAFAIFRKMAKYPFSVIGIFIHNFIITIHFVPVSCVIPSSTFWQIRESPSGRHVPGHKIPRHNRETSASIAEFHS